MARHIERGCSVLYDNDASTSGYCPGSLDYRLLLLLLAQEQQQVNRESIRNVAPQSACIDTRPSSRHDLELTPQIWPSVTCPSRPCHAPRVSRSTRTVTGNTLSLADEPEPLTNLSNRICRLWRFFLFSSWIVTGKEDASSSLKRNEYIV